MCSSTGPFSPRSIQSPFTVRARSVHVWMGIGRTVNGTCVQKQKYRGRKKWASFPPVEQVLRKSVFGSITPLKSLRAENLHTWYRTRTTDSKKSSSFGHIIRTLCTKNVKKIRTPVFLAFFSRVADCKMTVSRLQLFHRSGWHGITYKIEIIFCNFTLSISFNKTLI